MSHVDPGPLASYGSLSDPNLTAYFANSRMRKHLIKSGLITRRGEIVSEKVFRLNNARKEHQRHVRDLLAQAIVHKALDMERHRQMAVKRQLEEIGKVERVRRVRAERALRGDEDILPLLIPPQKSSRKKRRPHTAPAGKTSSLAASDSRSVESMKQLPQSVGYPAIPADSPFNTRAQRINTPYPNAEIDNQYLANLDQEALRTFTLNLSNYDLGSGVSPYNVPVLDPAGRQVVAPPSKPKKKKEARRTRHRPATAIGLGGRSDTKGNLSSRSNNKRSLELHRREPPMIYRRQPRSLCVMTFKYLGQIVHLDCESEDPRDEVSVSQQHCGGENLCVYKGRLLPGDNFTIISQRHRGFPFSLTFYLNGMNAERLSTCCEYKHKMGHKLGGKTSHFGFVKVEGAHPCYRCLVAMGRLRTTSGQSATKPKTFVRKKRGGKDTDSEKDGSKTTTDKEEDKYGDSFTSSSSSDESSYGSSVSTLTPSEDEEAEEAAKSDEKQEASPPPVEAPAPKSPEPPVEVKTPSPRSSSSSSSSEEEAERKSPEVAAEPEKVEDGSSSDSSSSSSSKASSKSSNEDEDLVVYHKPPAPLDSPIRSMMKEDGAIDLSNYELKNDQVEELNSILIDDSATIRSLTLYNCNLSERNLCTILETVSSYCTAVETVNIGRNKFNGAVGDSLIEVLSTNPVSTLVLDDNLISDSHMWQLMQGLEGLYKKSLDKKGNAEQLESSFNQLTILPPSPTSTGSKVPSLARLSLNRTGMGKVGSRAVADVLKLDPPVRELNLNGNAFGGDTLSPLWKVLSSEVNSHLTKLTVADNKLTESSFDDFKEQMGKRSTLEHLDFSNNAITEDGAEHILSFAKENNRIKHLRLSPGNTIKRKTLKRVKEACRNNSR